MQHRRLPVILALICAAVLLFGCAAPATAPVSEPLAPAETTAPAVTPAPTQPPTPTPTSTPTPAPTPFSIAWMSDTQEYSANNPDAYCSMTQWIADTRQERGTALYIHTGDAIRGSYRVYEWENMQKANALLPDDLPIITVAGNHDIIRFEPSYTPFLYYRPDTDFAPERAFGSGFTYWAPFEAGGVKLLVISIAYGEEREAVEWVDAVLRQNADRYAILCMHSYMSVGALSSAGKVMVDTIKNAPNLRLVLCGHERGTGYCFSEYDDDGDGTKERVVHQMLFNLQDYSASETGFLRMLRFDVDADTITVDTYSPYLDRAGCVFDPFGATTTLTRAGVAPYRVEP